MRTVDSTYKNGAKQKIRNVAVKIETNAAEAKTITADKIISATIQRSLTDGSFTIGNTPSDRLNAVVIDTDKLPKKTRVTISAAFDSSADERIGRFYVDKCTRNGQNVTITAFDALSLTETEVKFGGKASKNLEKLEFPCTMQQMLDYIVTLKGMTCEFECQPFTVQKKPMKSETEYYTARELFGFIAGCHACNAKMDYDGKLTFREFGKVAAGLTADNVLDMSVDDFEPFTVKGVLFSVGDDSIYIDDTPGSEYDAEADGIVQTNNPLATVEVAEYVWNKIGNLSYYGGSIKIRGEGILEPGDVVTVKNLKYPTDTTEYPVLITDISYSITRDGGFIETLSSAVSKKSSSNGGASNAGKSGSGISDQVRITSGKAYCNGETYRLQRGNNRRVIAVSKGADFCTLIDTDPYGTEAESEIAAATAILKGLEQRATVEFTFTNKTDSWYLSAPARFDNEEGASIDWGDGTTSDTLAGSHQFASGTFTVKISAPNAKKITTFSIYLGGSNDNDNIIYIGGGIEEINNCSAPYCQKVVFGESVKKLLKTSFGDDKLFDFAVPPCVQELELPYGNILCNTIYIPDTCVKLGSTAGYKRLTSVEICPDGSNLALEHSSGIFTGLSGSSRGLYAIRSLSLPSRCQTLGTAQQQFCWNQNVQFFRFERGCIAIPPSFLSSSLSVGARVYIPKTMTSIGTDALKAATVLFEGSQNEWDAITTNPNWNSGANCTVKCGAEYYNAYENDVNRDWGAENLGAGSGIEIALGTVSVSLKPGGGISSGGDGLYLSEASKSSIGGIRLGKGLATSGYGDKNTDVNLGGGMSFDNSGKIVPLLGSGLKFDEVSIEGDENGSTQAVVALNIGDGLDFDANGALTASMKPATPTSIGGVKAGTNITISEDGTISTPSYTGSDGVQISAGGTSRTVRLLTGNGLTFVNGKLTAFLGKNLKFSAGGEIESEFAVKNGIVLTNDESYKFIHNISEVLYQDSDYEVLTGAQDSFIFNKELIYGEGKTAPNGVKIETKNNLTDPSLAPDIPFKRDRFYIFDKALYGTTPIKAIDLAHVSSNSAQGTDTYSVRVTKDDDTTADAFTFTNYNRYSGYGMALLWRTIAAPGAAASGQTFENGYVTAILACFYKNSANTYTFIVRPVSFVIGFASKEEYYAAMGLMDGTVDLTDLVSDPGSGGSGSIGTGEKYKSPTVSLQRTTVGGRGAVKITIVDVLGTHTSYVYDGDALTRISQLTNDSGFVARKSGVPYNVVAIPGVKSATLVWEKVSGATQYRVQQLKNGTWASVAYPGANAYQAAGLTAGTEYAYRVLANVGGTWGGASEVAYVTPFSSASAASISGISEIASDEFEGEEVTI